MKIIQIYIILWLIFFFSCSNSVDPEIQDPPSGIEHYSYSIVNSYPHLQDAFTQGLYYHDGHFLESTGLYGQSSLRRVDLDSGKVMQRINLKSIYFAEGMTLWNDRIYQLTWRGGKGFVYDVTTFTQLDSFSYATEGWGLTHDGTNFILSNGSSILSFRSSENFEEIKQLEVTLNGNPQTMLNELEYIDGKIYANIWLTDNIAIIDPVSGRVTGLIDLTGLLPDNACPQSINVLNGIAYDPVQRRLFVTGKFWCRLFEIELVRQ